MDVLGWTTGTVFRKVDATCREGGRGVLAVHLLYSLGNRTRCYWSTPHTRLRHVKFSGS